MKQGTPLLPCHFSVGVRWEGRGVGKEGGWDERWGKTQKYIHIYTSIVVTTTTSNSQTNNSNQHHQKPNTNNTTTIAKAEPTDSLRSLFSESLMRTFRLLVRTPFPSYRGGGDGDLSGSALLVIASCSTVDSFSFAYS